MKSDITSLDLRYNFCTDCGIFLSEISWLEIPKNVQEGTNTMSVFIKCNGSPGSEVGYAGRNIQLVFTGLNKISIFIAYTSQTLSIDEILEREDLIMLCHLHKLLLPQNNHSYGIQHSPAENFNVVMVICICFEFALSNISTLSRRCWF